MTNTPQEWSPADIGAAYKRLHEAVWPFVQIANGTSGRIPTEKLSGANWHELWKAYEQHAPIPPSEGRTPEPAAWLVKCGDGGTKLLWPVEYGAMQQHIAQGDEDEFTPLFAHSARGTLTERQKVLLSKAASFVLAGEWPWSPERNSDREALEQAIAALSALDRGNG